METEEGAEENKEGQTEDIAKFDKLIMSIGDTASASASSRSAANSEQRRSLKMKLSSSTGKERRKRDDGEEDDDDADLPSSSSQAEMNSQVRQGMVHINGCPSCAKVVITVAPGFGYSAATGSGAQVVVLAE